MRGLCAFRWDFGIAPMRRLPGPESFDVDGPMHSKVDASPQVSCCCGRLPEVIRFMLLATAVVFTLAIPAAALSSQLHSPQHSPQPSQPPSPPTLPLPSPSPSPSPPWPPPRLDATEWYALENLTESDWAQLALLRDDGRFFRSQARHGEASAGWRATGTNMTDATLAQLREEHIATIEVTRFSDREPTSAELDAARQFTQRAYNAVHRNGWRCFERARAMDFKPMPQDSAHYYNEANILDGVVLDPDRPGVQEVWRGSGLV